MIFQIYHAGEKVEEDSWGLEEKKLRAKLENKLMTFPIHRLCVMKSEEGKESRIEIELDSQIISEKWYNKIVYRIFTEFGTDSMVIGNKAEGKEGVSYFGYFFYGKKEILGKEYEILVDVPSYRYY